MVNRFIIKQLKADMRQFPAVVLLGARQVGKTTVAKQYAAGQKQKAVYFDLEKESDRQKLKDSETVLSKLQDKCVIIDEAQTMPELFTALRPLIDENRRPGRFLLLGSVAPRLVKNISETLAGRIGHIEMGTITITEALKNKIPLQQLWHRGGYPQALLAKNDAQFYRWADNYYRSFVERDVNFLMGEALSPITVKKLWSMLAGVNGTQWNGDLFARSLGISRQTVNKYADFLEGAYLTHSLHPWFINIKKRIVKAPKIYFRDTGILHYLNQIHTADDILGNIAAGGSWEGFVVENITQLMPYWLSAYYYRTHHGAEADLVLVKGNTPIACIEIKLNNAPVISKGFYEVIADLNTKHNFVITPESDVYTSKNNVEVCNLQHFLQKVLPALK